MPVKLAGMTPMMVTGVALEPLAVQVEASEPHEHREHLDRARHAQVVPMIR
jgi:hypothetical protein